MIYVCIYMYMHVYMHGNIIMQVMPSNDDSPRKLCIHIYNVYA